jgi:hypothetical protein
MRQDDGLDSCVHVCWMPAALLATAPRPHVWLLGMNAGAWPRQSPEDVLLPAHIVPARMLEPVSPLTRTGRLTRLLAVHVQSWFVPFPL